PAQGSKRRRSGRADCRARTVLESKTAECASNQPHALAAEEGAEFHDALMKQVRPRCAARGIRDGGLELVEPGEGGQQEAIGADQIAERNADQHDESAKARTARSRFIGFRSS